MQCELLATLAAVCDTVPLEPADGGEEGGPPPAPAGGTPGPSWNRLLVGCDIFGALATCLSRPPEDDALLEAVALAGALAGHAALAPQLAESGVVSGGGEGARGQTHGARVAAGVRLEL